MKITNPKINLTLPIIQAVQIKPHLITEGANKTPERPLTRTIELVVVLDEWSPIHEIKPDLKYREKLALNIFDQTEPIETQKINSYLDHNISIENLLASTKNQSMTVSKAGNLIKAQIPVDESNPKLKRVADLIESGVIESNSFIFQALDYEAKQYENNPNLDLEIIYKSGKLISIDPVYEGFFSQAKCQVYNKDNNNIENINWAQMIQKKPAPESLIMNEQQPNIKAEVEATEKLKVKADVQELTQKLMSNELEIAKIAREIQDSRKVSRNQNAVLDYQELRQKFLNRDLGQDNSEVETFDRLWYEKYKRFLKSEKEFDNQIFFIGKDSPIKRALDGTSSLKGLALVENILQPGLLQEFQVVFPEFSELSQHVALTNLNIAELGIYVPAGTEIKKLAENAPSTPFGGQLFKIVLQPSRWSLEVSQNKALSNGGLIWNAQTQDAKNTIFRALKKEFYTTLFAHKEATISTLITTTANNYNGGVTVDAKVDCVRDKTITFQDLDNLIDSVVPDYVDAVLKDFAICMHPNTLRLLEKPFKETANPWLLPKVYDPINRTYSGIKIYTSKEYPYKPKANGEFIQKTCPAVLFNRRSVVAYGLDIVIEDDPYTNMSKDQKNRYVRTRGDIRLCDPTVLTRFLLTKNGATS